MTKCLKVRGVATDRVTVYYQTSRQSKIGIIQVYAPASDHSDKEADVFYKDIQKTIKSFGRDTIKII